MVEFQAFVTISKPALAIGFWGAGWSSAHYPAGHVIVNILLGLPLSYSLPRNRREAENLDAGAAKELRALSWFFLD